MKIGISTLTYDLNGARIINQDPAVEIQNNNGSRRCSRVATLDGGVSVTDTGYSAGDRDYMIETKDNVAGWFEYICKTYSFVKISTANGVFIGVPESWKVKNNKSQMTILITEEVK